MRKLSVFFIGILFSLSIFFCAPNNIYKASADKKNIVYLGGMAAGFTLKVGGVKVVGLCDVISADEVTSPSLQAGVRAGDRIVKIDNIEIDSIAQLNNIVENSNGKCLSFEIDRNEEKIVLNVEPRKDKASNTYKIGVLVKDSISGIGTITFIDKATGSFGALGHSIGLDGSAKMICQKAPVFNCTIIGVNKGVRGKAGELKGMFISTQQYGLVEKNCDCGIFGSIDKSFDYKNTAEIIANSNNVKPGNAYIYSTVNGSLPQKYEIEIVKVDKGNKENKNYIIKVTDKTLISQTGGIVQGMSGSPIVQGDCLIGAVTHVFLNDPTRGFGIDIKAMLDIV